MGRINGSFIFLFFSFFFHTNPQTLKNIVAATAKILHQLHKISPTDNNLLRIYPYRYIFFFNP
ncbi:hypothetical protein HanLR1_Chr02g0051211 [Helianthus annuus]|nr:hypothetical protein HanHA89_Chr02g0053631 [Helianthus annuus]KAJ0776917.1 hypothetical protein HanLR1_Chr02g0051211 [Helianthus annuus]